MTDCRFPTTDKDAGTKALETLHGPHLCRPIIEFREQEDLESHIHILTRYMAALECVSAIQNMGAFAEILGLTFGHIDKARAILLDVHSRLRKESPVFQATEKPDSRVSQE